MNITWLFGNGLDLGYGLKTSYYDFYEYLDKKHSQGELSNNVVFDMIQKDSDGNIELWSDYEYQLGRITSRFTAEQKDDLIDSKAEIDLKLCKYLLTQDSIIQFDEEEATSILKSSLQQMVKCNRLVDNDDLIKILGRSRNENLDFHPISFNYTSTLKKIWGNERRALPGFKVFQYQSENSSVYIDKPFYLHGDLNDGKMVIGVDNELQIESPIFSKDDDIKKFFIKNRLLDLAGENKFSIFKSKIEGSSIVCMYGLSIGKTDSIYWKIIKDRLVKTDLVLVIYYYDKEAIVDSLIYREKVVSKAKRLFYIGSEATEEEIQKIDSKIIVEINHILFTKTS